MQHPDDGPQEISRSSAELLRMISVLQLTIYMCKTWQRRAELFGNLEKSDNRPGGINPDIGASALTLLHNEYFHKCARLCELECQRLRDGHVSCSAEAEGIRGEIRAMHNIDKHLCMLQMPRNHPLRPGTIVMPISPIVLASVAEEYLSTRERRAKTYKAAYCALIGIRKNGIQNDKSALQKRAADIPECPISQALKIDEVRAVAACASVNKGKVQTIIYELISIIDGVNPATIERSLTGLKQVPQ